MDDSDLSDNEIWEQDSNSSLDTSTSSLSTSEVSLEYCLPSTSKAGERRKVDTKSRHNAKKSSSSSKLLGKYYSRGQEKYSKKPGQRRKLTSASSGLKRSHCRDAEKSTTTVVEQEKSKTSEEETENSLNAQTTFSPRETFNKRSGTTNIGLEYEDLTVASFILKLLKDKTIENFFISSNNEQFGSFDDVVLEVGPDDCYAFQLKHVINKSLTEAGLEADSGNFSIKKYFESFQKCRETMSGYKLVLLTNAKFGGDKDNVQLNIENIPVKMIKTELTPVLKTCSLVDCCYKFQITNPNEKTKDYETFFKNFILCTNQTNLQNLKQNVQNELKENFTIDDAVLDRYINFIYQWSSQEYKVKYKLSKNMMQKVLVLFMLNPFIKPVSFVNDVTDQTNLFQEVISKFNVTHFNINLANKVQKIWSNLRETLNDLEKVTKFNKMYQITKSHITEVKTLTDEECSKLLWVMNKCPLIVEENSVTERVIKLFPEQKYIVLRTETTEQETLKTNSGPTKLVNLEEYDELLKKVLKNYQCLLSGEKINLEKLTLNNNKLLEVITFNDLLQMLEKPYTIEDEEEELPVPYIDRFLSQNIISTEYFKHVNNDTFIVISNVTPECKYPQFKKPNFHVLETECLQEEFDNICNNVKMKRFHHFRLDNKQFVWLKSKGSVSDLKQYVLAGHSTPETVYREQNFHLSNNIFLISDEPGKGKSVLLKSFKNAIRSSHWTVLFTSNEISEICKNSRGTPEGFKDYLFNVKFKKYNEFERNILQFIYYQSKIVFMWDGLDEITSYDFKKVTELISKLPNFTHWITTRTHLTEKLEDKFCVLSISTEQFNEEQQQYYIKKRLEHIFDNDNLEKIVLTIKQYFENNNVCQFLSIPIQIYMITELLLQDSIAYSDILSRIFSLTDVYNYFVEEKLKLSYKTKSNRNDTPAAFNQFKSAMTEKYEKAALIAVFEAATLVEFGINCNEFPQFEDGDAFGFIINFDENSQKMHFVHQSYAEYFAALYLSKKYKNILSLKTILFDVRYKNIRFFFDLFLGKGSIPHIAVLNKNLEYLKNSTDLNVNDSGGRNVLHLAASWTDTYPLLAVKKKGEDCIIDTSRHSSVTFDKYNKELLQYILDKTDHTKTDDVFKMDPLSYAENTSCLYAFCAIVAKHNIDFRVGRKTEFVCNILYYCVQFRLDEVFSFVSNIEYIVTKNLDSLLHLAAENQCLEALKKIINFEQYRNKINNRNRLDETALHTLCKVSATEICMKQFVDFANFLIESGADINAADSYKSTPLHVACENGHYEIVDLLIKSGADINAGDAFKSTPLHFTCENSHYKIVDLLIKSGANSNVADKYKTTPIHVACEFGHYKIVDFLIKSGANITAADKYKSTPIHIACENGHYEIVDLLIKSGADITAADKFKSTPIHVACENGHYKIVDLLIKSGADITATDKFKSTPIHVASESGYYEIVDLLIKSGADVKAVNKDESTAIHVASRSGHYKIVDLLIKSGADINAVDKHKSTPIHVASENGHYEMVEFLINSGVDIKAVNKHKSTTIHVASENGHYEIVDLLIKSGADINAVDKYKSTPIHVAAENDHYETVDLLINSGADISAVDKYTSTPIHVASENGHFEIVDLLINSGADINAVDKYKSTSIHLASRNGHYKIVDLLIKSGTTVNAPDDHNRAPIHIACKKGHYEIVDLLINSGADINARDKHNSTPIHVASKKCHYGIVDLLIKSGANMNAADDHNRTPIHIASKKGHYEIVNLLIKSGADINVVDDHNKTPMLVASENGYDEIVELLIKSGSCL